MKDQNNTNPPAREAEGLHAYATHKPDCNILDDHLPQAGRVCTCGLTTARAEAKRLNREWTPLYAALTTALARYLSTEQMSHVIELDRLLTPAQAGEVETTSDPIRDHYFNALHDARAKLSRVGDALSRCNIPTTYLSQLNEIYRILDSGMNPPPKNDV